MTSRPLSGKRTRAAIALGVTLAVAGAGTAAAHGAGWLSAPSHDFGAVSDTYSGHGKVTGNVLHNDRGASAVVRHTDPSDGTVRIAADGSFTYTPKAGFKGTDTFTYTTTDAVQLFQDTRSNGSPLAPLAQVKGPGGSTTELSGEGYGSSLAPAPGRSGYFYGLTDRGPNADAPDGNKSEMLTSFVPQIGEFHLVGGKAELVKTVTLKGPRSLGGVKYSGRPPHDTSEVIDDVDATNANGGTPVPVADDPYGYDSEGLVVQPDGSFWVSDEYGPYITHFDANGYELGRLTPYRNSPDNAYHKVIGYLPAELANRAKNKGMEGLTITPDGSTLVGVMQSALQQPDLGKTKAAGVAPTRIVTVDLRTYKTRQYLYLLDNPSATGDANSEITALSATKFLVDERDGNYEPFAQKTLFEVDVNGATDVSGLLLDGKSPEAFVGASDTNTALAALTKAGVNVAQKQPYVNVGALVSQLDPTGAFFAHDKVEGVATADAGRTLYLSNDDDFGIDTIAVDPDGTWTVHQKVLPTTGAKDNGEILKVDTTKLPAVLKTVTVTVHVR
ncbi:esterase-like activity of phytase family protein [Actinacidiphila bryophytorum]|uniref:esterase-like activity of phytase family protein n=1 Tax=Actinacidiphila bryophytorum TaxID=1436133 RepID=UPI002176C50B|nr:esterase-like activity of phytase family protein [Actinacidiphila bryophytorum]UWE13283.1 esterase-like activity of phytase family protein [Actinacidiphila bryophytorum]